MVVDTPKMLNCLKARNNLHAFLVVRLLKYSSFLKTNVERMISCGIRYDSFQVLRARILRVEDSREAYRFIASSMIPKRVTGKKKR
jgi:hypothetical protein